MDGVFDAAILEVGGDAQPLAEGGDTFGADGIKTTLCDHHRALPIIAARNHHEHLACRQFSRHIVRLARQARQAQPENVERRAKLLQLQSRLCAQCGMTAIGGHGQPGADLDVAGRTFGQHTGDALAGLGVALG